MRLQFCEERNVNAAIGSGPAGVPLQTNGRIAIEHGHRAAVCEGLESEIPARTRDLVDRHHVIARESHEATLAETHSHAAWCELGEVRGGYPTPAFAHARSIAAAC